VVTNTLSSGAGSFAQAILDANSNPGLDEIDFAVGSGACKINLSAPLPAVTDAAFINGTSQPGYNGSPLVELNGTAAGAGANGLWITGGGSTVRGLVINNFASGFGVLLQTGGGNVVAGNRIGTSRYGGVALANLTGVGIVDSSANTVGGLTQADRNLISGNAADGVSIEGTSTFNQVQGNYVGTDRTGAAVLANGADGVFVFASGNTVGGTARGASNVIGGNGQDGVEVNGSGNLIAGNSVGVSATDVRIGNLRDGVRISGGTGNTVGGTTGAARNVLSGNGIDNVTPYTGYGVSILADGNLVVGNYVGLDQAGLHTITNGLGGVSLSSSGNTVGGTLAGARNVIATTQYFGVLINGDSNQVAGNYIDADKNGTGGIGGGYALEIQTGTGNLIGGTGAAARNLITSGVTIYSNGNLVQGNYIGPDKTGTVLIGGGLDGVDVYGDHNTIGGLTAGARNVISGFDEWGVVLAGDDNVVQGNYIGTDKTGAVAMGNGYAGVHISGAFNTVGGSAAGARNVISGNGGGVDLTNQGNVVRGNYIGTDSTGTKALGNGLYGVATDNAWDTLITDNVISANGTGAYDWDQFTRGDGIVLFADHDVGSNRVSHNKIGTDKTGLLDLGNVGYGIEVDGATAVLVSNTVDFNGLGPLFVQ
jgi:titin